MLIHLTDLTCMHGKTNIFVNDDSLDNFTPQDIINDQVPINTNLTTTPPEGTQEPTTQHTLPDPNTSTKTNTLPALRRTTRTTHTPHYLKKITSIPCLACTPLHILCPTTIMFVSVVSVLIVSNW